MILLMIFFESVAGQKIRIRIRIMSMSRKKPGLLSQPGLLNYYPTNAVKADIPFPFGNGRTTAT